MRTVALLDEVQEVDPGGIGIATGAGHHQPQVGGKEVVLSLAALTHQPIELDLLDLAFEAALLEASLGALARLDLLGKLDLQLGGEQVVLADRAQILAHQVGGEPAPIVCQRVPLPIAPLPVSNWHG